MELCEANARKVHTDAERIWSVHPNYTQNTKNASKIFDYLFCAAYFWHYSMILLIKCTIKCYLYSISVHFQIEFQGVWSNSTRLNISFYSIVMYYVIHAFNFHLTKLTFNIYYANWSIYLVFDFRQQFVFNFQTKVSIFKRWSFEMYKFILSKIDCTAIT